ncbi:MAG: hypothetical protein A3B53_02340 [Candidatus Levybacteria bacterium RIFCSPLOWO2_01_FULL_42_15]|nr:MAG: hypothetical protein A3B53_02340 [Candidatus Levybacteria bacterium RIFCSPLOWO2_01_FULL_42_15]
MVIRFMEKTVANILGWILMPVYWIRYPGAMIRGGCLIDIFTVTIKKNARVGCNSWIGPNVILEEYSILGRDAKISNVSIDKFTSIGADFKVLPYGHNYNRFSTFSFYILLKKSKQKALRNKERVYYGYTKIEKDVWIGENVSVIGGSTIKNGGGIGTHSLVKGLTQEFGIYGGVPAKLIKFRFSPNKIKEYKQSSWYNKPIDELIAMAVKN